MKFRIYIEAIFEDESQDYLAIYSNYVDEILHYLIKKVNFTPKLFTFVLDRSGSMNEKVGYLSKAQISDSLIFRLVQSLSSDLFSYILILFNTEIKPFEVKDSQSLKAFLKRNPPNGGTALNDALAVSFKINSEISSHLEKHVIVLTDGWENSSKHFPNDMNSNLIQFLTKNMDPPNRNGVHFLHAWLIGDASKDFFKTLASYRKEFLQSNSINYNDIYIQSISEVGMQEQLFYSFYSWLFRQLLPLFKAIEHDIIVAQTNQDLNIFKLLHLVGAKLLWIISGAPGPNTLVPVDFLHEILFKKQDLNLDFWKKFFINGNQIGLFSIDFDENQNAFLRFKVDLPLLNNFLNEKIF